MNYSDSNVPIASAVHVVADDSRAYPYVNSNTQINTSGCVQPAEIQYNESNAREFLTAHQWPTGLQDTFMRNLQRIPYRFFVCDDSGSMITVDGHQLLQTSRGQKRMVSCTRWTELTEALKFHAGIARASGAPCEFRFLNGSYEPIIIGGKEDPTNQNYNRFMQLVEISPSGGTPLCKHIREVTAKIRVMEPQLRAANQKVCVIIASDGESSDGDIAEALRPLRELPAWVVVRLCTDEDKIVSYWNSIDSQLEVEMDVLDDLIGEASEVYEGNPWLTYGEPMHRLREFGIPIREIDLLDSRLLSLGQVRLMASVIYGGSVNDYPHPEVDWGAFVQTIRRHNSLVGRVWSPYHRTDREWINTSKLSQMYHRGFSCSIS